MKYPNQNRSNNFYQQSLQWRAYQQLELIPDSIPNLDTPAFAFGIGFLWRGLLDLLADELVDEQRVEYLERCWTLNEVEEKHRPPYQTLQRLWMLME